MDDTLATRHHDGPLDRESRDRLAGRGLRLARMRNDDEQEYAAWDAAMRRGFLEEAASAEDTAAGRPGMAYRRLIGVLDDEAAEPQIPVGTVASWVAELTVPGGVLPSVGISSVTVSPTHRRRGIARALLEGELRTAAALGLPVASLTVTESALYGRYGFGLAASVASMDLDTRRAGWAGPTPDGRVDFISRERWREIAPAVFDRVRRTRPGEFTIPDSHWDRFAGMGPGIEKPGRIRAVQYRDASGMVAGAALYSIAENAEDFSRGTVELSYLLAETDDAYAALWRFFVEMDLIGTLKAAELSVDEPLWWMIADRRAATVRVHDHHYVRILDVAAALQARRYRAPGRLLLEVVDPLEITGGRFVLTIDDDGTAVATPAGARATAPVTLTTGISELSSLLLGQVSARTLSAAGRLRATDAGRVADLFAWDPPARLSYWY